MVGSKSEIASADFVFFCRHFEQTEQKERRFRLSTEDFALLNPNTMTCPIFRTGLDAELAKKIYQRVPVLINEKKDENPWGISFLRMLDMANDSHLFKSEPVENSVPLYEAKMIHQFDHRYGTYEDATQAQLNVGSLPQSTSEQKQDHDYHVLPRYWVDKCAVAERLTGWEKSWLLGFRDVTSSVVERTAIFSVMPYSGVGHTLPLVFIANEHTVLSSCFVGNVNSLILDYVVRQKLGGNHLTYFILKQLPLISPYDYSEKDKEFISARVIELVYTSNDIQPFAQAMGYDGPPFRWDDKRRPLLRSELDAYYAKLYGLTRDELRYVLDPQDVYGPDFPGETFRVLKEKEIKQHGEYRTRRLVLEAWDRLFGEK